MPNTIIIALKAIITYNHKALIVQRSAKDEIGANTWEFPGGKLEFGEDLETALKREVQEETGLQVTVNKLLYAETFKTHAHRQIVILSYLCKSQNDAIILSNEHQNYRWADKNQMLNLLHAPIISTLNKYAVWAQIYER